MKTLLSAFFTFFLFTAIAQTPIEKCLTPEMDTAEFFQQPWYDNNDFLEQFLDSIGYPLEETANRIVGAASSQQRLPKGTLRFR